MKAVALIVGMAISSLLPASGFARQPGAQNVTCKDGTTILAMAPHAACADHGGIGKRKAPEGATDPAAPK